MASLKLKVEERERLYYNKYSFKLATYLPGSYYTSNVKTIDQFRDRINSIQSEIKRFPTYYNPVGDDIDDTNIEKLIKYQVEFMDNDKGTMRREGNFLNFYSNDLSFLKKFPKFDGELAISEVKLLPNGVKYFTREPPAQYRLHLKETRISTELKMDMLDYVTRTAGLTPSSALMTWLQRSTKWHICWVSKSYFIDYDDPSQLTMLHLLFSEVVGKNYKLEKK